jgi:serine/threonine protein kinase, bacterial
MPWKNWGDHPVVVTLSVVSGLIGTGIAIFSVLKPLGETAIPPSKDPIPSSALVAPAPKMRGQAIGWIRLGAIDHEKTTLRSGTPLIVTSQPITISPPVVPKIGDRVSTITGVNLRGNHPTPPKYDAEDQTKISVLAPATKLAILKTSTFVDPIRPSITIIWGEVSLDDP